MVKRRKRESLASSKSSYVSTSKKVHKESISKVKKKRSKAGFCQGQVRNVENVNSLQNQNENLQIYNHFMNTPHCPQHQTAQFVPTTLFNNVQWNLAQLGLYVPLSQNVAVQNLSFNALQLPSHSSQMNFAHQVLAPCVNLEAQVQQSVPGETQEIQKSDVGGLDDFDVVFRNRVNDEVTNKLGRRTKGVELKTTTAKCEQEGNVNVGGACGSEWSELELDVMELVFKYYAPPELRLNPALDGFHFVWNKIAEYLPKRTHIDARAKWLEICTHGRIKKIKYWTNAESLKLKLCVEGFGIGAWEAVACYFPSRTAVQCKERWLTVCDPNRKRCPWTAKETQIFEESFHVFGNNWKLIAEKLPGRTRNDVKNFWHQKNADQNPVPLEAQAP